MRKYLYLIKKAKIKSWLKFWLMTNKQFTIVLSEILEGFSFNLQNTVKKRFKIFNIFGNSVQDGTPTPTNPVTIESVADDVNLFDKEAELVTYGYISSYKYSNGIYTIIPTGTGNPQIRLKFILPAGTYTLNSEAYLSIATILRNNNGILNNFQDEYQNQTFTTTETSAELFFNWANPNNTNPITLDLRTLKIQKGTVATPYSPYNDGTFTIDFEGQTENYNYTFITKPLRSLPNGVRDSLEDDGIHRRIRVLNLPIADMNNNEDYPGWVYLPELVAQFPNQNINFKDITNFMCNIAGANSSAIGINTNAIGVLWLYKSFFGLTQSQWKEQYPNLVVKIQYQLSEEIIEPYTEEQQAEYNKIKELYTFDGTTNISSDDDVPPYLQIQYYMKGE